MALYRTEHTMYVHHTIWYSAIKDVTVGPLYSIEGTIGTQLAVLYRVVSLIQTWICTQLYVVGTTDSVL